MDTSTIPAQLASLDRWVCWRNECRNGRPTKVPISVHTGYRTDVTMISNLAKFEDAVVRAKSDSSIAGVGFAFILEDGLIGIDLDGCIRDGQMVEAASAVVRSLGSYSEISPSGTGVKIIMRGTKPPNSRCRSSVLPGMKGIEIYDRDRFFTVTGHHLPGTPEVVTGHQAALNALATELWPPPLLNSNPDSTKITPIASDDDHLIRKALAARNGHRFQQLWAGDTTSFNGDHSAADLALCSMLSFWTGGDARRMDRLFRSSGLFRDKWDAPRGLSTYGWMTINKALGKGAGSPAAARRKEVNDGAC